jgi:hypothetical protein
MQSLTIDQYCQQNNKRKDNVKRSISSGKLKGDLKTGLIFIDEQIAGSDPNVTDAQIIDDCLALVKEVGGRWSALIKFLETDPTPEEVVKRAKEEREAAKPAAKLFRAIETYI